MSQESTCECYNIRQPKHDALSEGGKQLVQFYDCVQED